MSDEQPWVHGLVDRVPCPWCGKHNNLAVLQDQRLLDTGHRLFCDQCHRSMEVVAVRQVTLVSVRADLPPGFIHRKRLR